MTYQDLSEHSFSKAVTSYGTHLLWESVSDGEVKHLVVPHETLLRHYNQHNVEPFLDDPELAFKKPLKGVSDVSFEFPWFHFRSEGFALDVSLKDLFDYGDIEAENFTVNDEEFVLSNGLTMLGEVIGFNENLLIVRPNLKGFNNLVKKLTYTLEVSGLSNESIMWLSDPVPYYETVCMKRLSAIDLKPEDHLITCRPVEGKTVYFAEPVG